MKRNEMSGFAKQSADCAPWERARKETSTTAFGFPGRSTIQYIRSCCGSSMFLRLPHRLRLRNRSEYSGLVFCPSALGRRKIPARYMTFG